MPQSSSRWRGALLATFGVVCVSPDATLMRIMVESTGASNQQVVFWKSLTKILLILLLITWSKGIPKAIEGAKLGKRYLLSASAVQACIDVGFSNMILLTTVARAMLFYSLNPLFAALMGRLLLDDKLERRTIVALIASACAIGLIFLPDITSHRDQVDASARSDVGDCIALVTGMSMAAYISIVRAAHQRDPEIYMVPGALGGSVIAASLAAISILTGVADASSSSVEGDKKLATDNDNQMLPPTSQAYFSFLIIVDAACVAIMLVCLTLAPRSLSSAEVSLITLLETVLGPLMVFVMLGEKPGFWTALGGGILLLTLFSHEMVGIYEGANKGNTEAERNEEENSAGRRSNELVTRNEGTVVQENELESWL